MERKKEIIKSILFYYSLIILALLVLVGLGASKSLQDYVNTFLFVPVLVFVALNYKNFYKIK